MTIFGPILKGIVAFAIPQRQVPVLAPANGGCIAKCADCAGSCLAYDLPSNEYFDCPTCAGKGVVYGERDPYAEHRWRVPDIDLERCEAHHACLFCGDTLTRRATRSELTEAAWCLAEAEREAQKDLDYERAEAQRDQGATA